VCPSCGKEYPRVKRYTKPVSCGRCDARYNPAFALHLKTLLGTGYRPPRDDEGEPRHSFDG